MLSKELADFIRVNLTEVGLLLKEIREIREAKRYNPNQPRVPAGTPEGGQWTDANGGIATATTRSELDQPERVTVAGKFSERRRPMCDAQQELDLELCRMAKSTRCWETAMVRHAACMSGNFVPELRF